MWAHHTPRQPALFTWRPCNPLQSEVSKPLSDDKRPTKERKERERDTRLHSLHKSWMKTVFFCNLIWEMLIERQGWEGVGGWGVAGARLPLQPLLWLAPQTGSSDPLIGRRAAWSHRPAGEEREGRGSRHLWVNLNKRYLKRKRCR